MIGEALGSALDTSENLANTLIHTTATISSPNIIGALSQRLPSKKNQSRWPSLFNYSDGWKMFFASDSPHYQHATQLATNIAPVGNGAIFTFSTPDSYPIILNQR